MSDGEIPDRCVWVTGYSCYVIDRKFVNVCTLFLILPTILETNKNGIVYRSIWKYEVGTLSAVTKHDLKTIAAYSKYHEN